MSLQTNWILLALASGLFAALNGVFAKLTTAPETTSFLDPSSHRFLDLFIRAVRSICFTLNLLSNLTMWALFTRALTSSTSTTKVSITNTAANFVITALLGGLVFGETLPGKWWVGAGCMGVGCVLVGMREN